MNECIDFFPSKMLVGYSRGKCMYMYGYDPDIHSINQLLKMIPGFLG